MLDFHPQNIPYISIYESITHHFGKRRIFKNGGETLETLFNYTFVFVTKKVCHLCACLVHF